MSQVARRSLNRLRLHQKLSIPHNLLVVDPYIEFPPHHINMRRRIPFRPGMRAVRISKRNVNPRIFLILQNLPNHFLEIDVRPNGKFAHAVTVFVGVRVLPEVVFQFAIVGMRLREPVSLDVNRRSRTCHSLRQES